VQTWPSSQLILHVDGGSHVSLSSRLPFPQLGEQSESVFELQPSGQQWSAATHSMIAVIWQTAVQVAASPSIAGLKHGSVELHMLKVGQFPSHVSPASTLSLPQRAGSLMAGLFAAGSVGVLLGLAAPEAILPLAPLLPGGIAELIGDVICAVPD
jgi:hypothetical protein